MELRGTALIIVIAVLSFQELVVGIMIIIKIKRSATPIKVQYIQSRFGKIEDINKKEEDIKTINKDFVTDYSLTEIQLNKEHSKSSGNF
jgi:hypothetical protein